MALETGHVVDRYEVLRTLGQGGMAAVYLVRHTTLGSEHALKVLTLDRPGLRERLLQEGRMQAALRHDCAVTVTDVIDVDGAPGLILEYVDGPTLDDWLIQDPPRELRLDLFRQIVGAVQAAHDMGLVHRDLKPGNVLVESRPEGPRAKVTDFGIAKALSEDEGAGQTRSGTAMGTPAYMAPEQMRDASTVDHRADVWALGAILYELMTGQVALGQGTLVETWERAKTADFEDPSVVVPDLPSQVAAAIRSSLEPDRDKRVASCTALLTLLDGGQAETPDFAFPVPPPKPGLKRQHLIGIAAVAAVALFCGLGTVSLGVLSSLGGSEPEACETGWFGTVGYARASALFRWSEGDEWRLPRRIDVYGSVPRTADDGHVVCYLPAGSKVTVSDDPIRAHGRTWVEVGARGFELPD
ncbi:MAG: serine/threonine protein kinase [Proteobacteria bacterium]|nr:serine/threonine protein kinase [Pseudomonadota bacterium]